MASSSSGEKQSASSSSPRRSETHEQQGMLASSSQQNETEVACTVDLEPTYYCDDEPLPPYMTNVRNSLYNDLPRVHVTATPECSEVIATVAPNFFPVLVRITAPSMLEYRRYLLQRAPIDLVIVLDITQSNDKLMLDRVKKAVQFVIENMCSWDRLSIVLSWPNARRVSGLRLMTPRGQEEAKQTVRKLVFTEGPTNMAKALTEGSRVLGERREHNPVVALMVFSNCKYTCGVMPQTSTDQREPPEYLHLLPESIYPRDREQSGTFPVYAFGIGQDHDPTALHALSAASGGTYSYVESHEVVEDAIASCIGGLLSVVTQELELYFFRWGAVKFQSIYSGQFYSGIFDSGTVGVIKVGNLYAGEVKEFVIYLSLSQLGWLQWGEVSSVPIIWFYNDAVANGSEQLYCDIMEINRPMLDISDVTPEELRRQKTRIFGAESIEEVLQIAERGDLSHARNFLLARMTLLSSYNEFTAKRDGLCLWLLSEMCEIQLRLTGDERNYKENGRAYILANVSSHGSQRPTAIGSRRPDYGGLAYGTATTRDLVHMSRIFRLVRIRNAIGRRN